MNKTPILTVGVAFLTLGMGTAAIAGTPLAKRQSKPVRITDTGRTRLHRAEARSEGDFDISLLKPQSRLTPFSRSVLPGSVASLPAPYSSGDQGEAPMLRANVLFSTSWTGGIANYGIYEFPAETSPEAISLVAPGNDDWYATAGAVYAGANYFMASSTDYYGYRIISCTVVDTNTWEQTAYYYGEQDFQALDMAYDRTTGNIYGAFMDMNLQSYVFGQLDITNGHVTLIRDLGRGTDSRWAAIGVDGSGNIYSISNNGTLFKVDPQTGATETIGSTGLSSRYLTTGAIDPETGAFYYATCNDHENTLYRIDTSTAAVTRLYDMPGSEQLTGMYVARSEALPSSPAVVTDLQTDFSDDNLTGAVSFRMPSSLFGGEAAEGEGEWLIRLNGKDYSSGKASYGSEVTAEVTVDGADMYTVSVFARNASGLSPVTKTDIWIGKDVPAPVEDVRLTYSASSEKFTISWKAAKASHNAFFEPSEVTYDVVRYPDGVTVATDLKAVKCTDKVKRPEERVNYRYAVIAKYAGASSAPSYSGDYPLGPIVPPFLETFDSEQSLVSFTIIDENRDGTRWDWFSGAARMAYSYNGENRDWLISPAVKVEAGKAYRITLEARSYNPSYPERVALYAGKAPDAASMTMMLADRTDVSTYESIVLVEGFLAPEEDGEYYIGILGCSDPMMYYLYVDNFRISEGFASQTPERVSDFTIVADESGYPEATLSFRNPEQDVAGRPLSSVSKTEIYRDDRLLTTLQGAPGEMLTFRDSDVTDGQHTYQVVVWNGEYMSFPAEYSLFVGNDVPVSVSDLKITPSEGGELHLSWTPVTVDVRGRNIPDGRVTYNVTRFMGNSERLIKSGLSDCGYVDVPLDEDEDQAFVQYAVNAVTSVGSGEYAITEMYPVGEAYGLPFEESFADRAVSHIWAVGKDAPISTGSWDIMSEEESEVPSADGDGWMVSFYSGYTYDQAIFYSGKIAIPADALNPVLSFYCFFINDSTNRIEVMVDGGEGFETLNGFTAGGYDGWRRIELDLSKYAGKVIRVAFNGICGNYNLTPLDAIRIMDVKDNDIRLSALSVPEKVTAGESFMVTAEVENIGLKEASGWYVTLYRNGVIAGRADGKTLLPGEKALITLDQTLSPVDGETADYSAEAVYEADQNVSDNSSVPVKVEIVQTTLPTVSGVEAGEDADGVVLTWERPDLDALPLEPVTESFEDYPHLAKSSFGGWQSVDRDGIGAGGIDDTPLEGIDGEPVSFFVMDGDEMGLNFEANTGSRYLCSMWVYGASTRCNDWLVSPELQGGAQTVSFYARCYHPSYPESFEVYWSDSPEIDTMQLLFSETTTSRLWKRYEVELPEGARYFAIRGTSDNAFMLFVDDITYLPFGATPKKMELLGYNIYRDGVRLNTEPVSAETFTDNGDVAEGTRYHVCAVYDLGESAPVEVVFYRSGIVNAGEGALRIWAGHGLIEVDGPEGTAVRLTASDGKVMAEAVLSGKTCFSVPAGVYLVSGRKVVVR